jgi:hypothetical protein
MCTGIRIVRPLFADPEGRVGRELVALAPVELLARPNQPEDPLLDQVEQRQVLTLVLLRDRDDEPQVRIHEPLLRLEVPALDRLGDLDLLLRREQRVTADLVEEELQGVGRLARDVAVRDLRLLDAVAAAVVRHLEAARLDPLVHGRDLLLVELEVLDRLAELGEVHAADLLALVDQGIDSVCERVGHLRFSTPFQAAGKRRDYG